MGDEVLRWYARTAADGLAGDGVRFDSRFGGWTVHRFAEVERVLGDHEVFSSDELRYSSQAVPHGDNPLLGSLVSMDPPRHHTLRRLVGRVFTPRAVVTLRPFLLRLVDELLDAAGREVRVVEGFASPLAVGAIAGLLGVSAERRSDFVRWTEAITSFAGRASRDPVRRKAFDTARAELSAYLLGEFADRRREPREDVISTLLAAEPDGTRLSDDELLNFCTLLLVNGHETTTSLIAHAVLWLGNDPVALRGLRAEPELLPGVVGEVLRLLPPVGGTDRFATRRTTLGGHVVEAGQRVVVDVVAANRDPEVFVEPGVFEPRREPVRHLSFGRGVHFCLGAHLARMEAEIAVRALVERVSGEWSPPVVEVRRTPVGLDVVELVLA